jgi:hypothetical protein
MRMFRALITPAALALTLALAAPGGAAPAATTIDTLSSSVSGTTVTLSGSATLGGEDTQVGTDAANDNLGGATVGAMGTDLRAVRIGVLDPGSGNLVFTFKLAGLTGGGFPETVSYNWDIAVDGGTAAGGADWRLTAMRTRYLVNQNTEPYGAIFTCTTVAGGASQCAQNRLIPAQFDEANGEVRLIVPMEAISASLGSTITSRGTSPLAISATAFGSGTATGLHDVAGPHAAYTIPRPTVFAGLAPAGEAIAYTKDLGLQSNNTFIGLLPAPGAGEFDAGVRVCLGGNCATRTLPVTVDG